MGFGAARRKYGDGQEVFAAGRGKCRSGLTIGVARPITGNMQPLSPLGLLLLISAPAFGSFLAVLADRLPRGQSLVGRSACRSCGATLAARDLVPGLSFLINAGRCRQCGAAIPPWLLYMEIAATGLAVIALVGTRDAGLAWLVAGFLWCLLALIVCDLRSLRLPDLLTGALFVLALALSARIGMAGLGEALIGALVGAGAFWAIRAAYQILRGREGLGLGDVKLMAGLGAALGPLDLPLMVLLASLASLAAALTGIVTTGQRPAATTPLPFGAALAAAGGLLWVARHLPL